MFYQLKTLIWRNIILKKRRLFSTLLEIFIPIIISLVVGYLSKTETTDVTYEKIENFKITDFKNFNLGWSQYQIEFGFIFPSEFDIQKQNVFLNNFKKDEFFNSFRYVENTQSFTELTIDNGNDENIVKITDTSMAIHNTNTTEKAFSVEKSETLKQQKYMEYISNRENTNSEVNITERNNDSPNQSIDINENENENEIENSDKIWEYTIETLKDEEEMNEKQRKYRKIGIHSYSIIFSSLTKYKIRFYYYEELYEKVKEFENVEYFGDMYNGEFEEVITYQSIINKSIIKMLSPNSQDFDIKYTLLDRNAYTEKIKDNKIQRYIPLIMTFSFIPCICNLLVLLVIEKESKIKESLVIIGLNKSSFWVSWTVTYGFIIILSSIIVTAILKFNEIFTSIHWSLLILSITIYGLSCCFISFILSTLINKSKTANTVGAMMIVVFCGIGLLELYIKNEPKIYNAILFISSQISFISFFDYLDKYDRQRININLFNLFGKTGLKNAFFGLLFTFFLYLIIAIYLDNVLPQGSNLHKKWHFFVTDLFKNRKEKSKDSAYSKTESFNKYIQKDPENIVKAVKVTNISKSFNVRGEKIEILKHINFNTYSNEIFAILGHNGAGKTTLLNIMTGILSSTHGEVYYDDIPITGNETNICKQFGYCPQFDTFNDNLTVREHIKLFVGIKGIKVDIDAVLEDIDLTKKENNFPRELSGGQKRKLCIALALLGSPKYVFLDEPTTGLDPYSRKNIWELLSRKKEGRVIFVTTHYMDEADLLADRKMILSNGEILCLGSSLFLKQQFNMSYSLDVYCEDVRDSWITDKILDNICPGTSTTKIISNSNMQAKVENSTIDITNDHENYIISYLIPMKYSNLFKIIFEKLNGVIRDHGNTIKNFSLTAPTLEELFINLENHAKKEPQYQEATNTTAIDLNSDNTTLLNHIHEFSEHSMKKSSSLHQIYVIVKLRLKLFFRNKTFAFLYTLLPIILCVLCMCVIHFYVNRLQLNKPTIFQPLTISPALYGSEKWFKEANMTSPVLDYINKIDINMDTIHYAEDISVSSGKDLSKLNYVGGFYGFMENQKPQFILYKNITDNFARPIAVNLLSNAILKQNGINEQISVEYQPYDYYDDLYEQEDTENIFNVQPERVKNDMENLLIFVISLSISLCISVFGPYTIKEKEEGILHQLFLNGTQRINYWIGVLISDSLCISIPILVIALAGYLNNISLYHPKIIVLVLLLSVLWIIGCLLHQYVISFLFSSYEKVSTLIVIFNPILCAIVSVIIVHLSTSSFLVITEEVENEYNNDPVMKTKFQKYKMILYFMYIFVLLFVPGMIILFYSKINTFVKNEILNFTQEEIETFLLSDKAKSILTNPKITKDEKSKLLKKIFFEMKTPTLKDLFHCKDKFMILIIMVVLAILIYGTILFIMEKVKQKKLLHFNEYTSDERQRKDKVMENGPMDVQREWRKVAKSIHGHDGQSVLRVFQLTKDFVMKSKEVKKFNKKEKEASSKTKVKTTNNKKRKIKRKTHQDAFQKMDHRMVYDNQKKKHVHRIVDDVTFGVNMGECLGLLGPNGAGKTTTISMITGLLSHTHGIIKYGDKDLTKTEIPQLSLGYCSQHDSLWELLTVKEIIEFYLHINGYPRQTIGSFAKALIEACGIESHSNKKVREISGGTKRKLSLIISICSLPKYLILDEPSAGMDPFTRRYIWKLISNLKSICETATILTTHSTEEAEALCDRIAILIKGRLVCIDTPRSIKMNHSNTYILEVFTTEPERFEEKYVKEQNLFGLGLNETYVMESSINYQKYTVKINIENMARIFSLMEEAKAQQLVSQYNFGQFSLEQVFIDFVHKL